MEPKDITRALTALQQGSVIVYPADTVYGLGADATNVEAVACVRAIKGRADTKPILAMVADLAMLETYAHMTPLAYSLAKKYLPGPLTLVLTAKGTALAPVASPDGSVGFRIPNHPWCHALSRAYSHPITSTSVNKSGLPQPDTLESMMLQLGEQAHLVSEVLDYGTLPPSSPSTIVDARGTRPIVLRQGELTVVE